MKTKKVRQLRSQLANGTRWLTLLVWVLVCGLFFLIGLFGSQYYRHYQIESARKLPAPALPNGQ